MSGDNDILSGLLRNLKKNMANSRSQNKINYWKALNKWTNIRLQCYIHLEEEWEPTLACITDGVVAYFLLRSFSVQAQVKSIFFNDELSYA